MRKAYKGAGGTVQDTQEKKLDPPESMPKEIWQQFQWRKGLPEAYGDLRDMPTGTADDICYQDGIKASGGSLHAVENPKHALGSALDQVGAAKAAGYFRHAGYRSRRWLIEGLVYADD